MSFYFFRGKIRREHKKLFKSFQKKSLWIFLLFVMRACTKQSIYNKIIKADMSATFATKCIIEHKNNIFIEFNKRLYQSEFLCQWHDNNQHTMLLMELIMEN